MCGMNPGRRDGHATFQMATLIMMRQLRSKPHR
jgi:hypothetical protein